MKYVLTSLMTAAVLLSSNDLTAAAPEEGGEESVKKLIENLSSDSGQDRIAATKAIFDKGDAGLAALRQAGAKQISPHGTINTRRLDLTYSLLEGFRKNPAGGLAGYRADSFGLHFDPGVSEQEVVELGRKHGFTISGRFNADGHPQCYVKLNRGKALEPVIKAILLTEPTVVTINLNYFEA